MESENKTLFPDHILKTIDLLCKRIEARFGERGLSRTCRDLAVIGRRSAMAAESLGRPYWGLRVLSAVLVGLGVYGLVLIILYYGPDPRLERGTTGPLFLAQGLESLVNLFILIAGALFFVTRLERRLKRHRALKRLYELRSIAHVVDMHQLTKDPQAMLALGPTPYSPKRDLSPGQLMRYLDYCTEMLSLTAKLAALYNENLRDTEVSKAVNEIETLSASLSNKIFQKIQMVHRDQVDYASLNVGAKTASIAGHQNTGQ